MSDGVVERAETDGWNDLLAQTRQALASLRAGELEELAARAETMFGVFELVPDEEGRTELVREHRLLEDLLLATDRDLAVLRRLRGDAGDRAGAWKVNPRWAR